MCGKGGLRRKIATLGDAALRRGVSSYMYTYMYENMGICVYIYVDIDIDLAVDMNIDISCLHTYILLYMYIL